MTTKIRHFPPQTTNTEDLSRALRDIVDELNCVDTRYNIVPIPWQKDSTSPPASKRYGTGSSVGVEVPSFSAGADGYVNATVALPSDYKEGTTVYLQAICTDDADSGNSYILVVEYGFVVPDNGDTLTTTGTTLTSTTITPTGAANTFARKTFTLAASKSLKVGSGVAVRFGRNGASAGDTYTKTVDLLGLHLVYEVDDIRGSESTTSKYV